MSSVIVWSNPPSVRRCDVRCHEGKSSNCDCICGGMNHGKGYEIARENTSEMVKRDLQLMDKSLVEKDGKVYLSDTKQLPLL